jgi:putative tricarboxylic transport membrane protein
MQRSAISLGDVISGAALAVLGTYIVLAAREWTFLGHDGPGPGFFPEFYGIGLIVGSLMLVVQGLRKRTVEGEPIHWGGIALALGVWLVFVLMLPVMKYLGFPIALAILIVFFLQVVFKRSWRFTILAAVLTPIGFVIIFPTLLQVQLPVGQWTGF